MKEAGSKATLKELQKEILNSIAKGDRGVKSKNPKRSVNNIDKWEASSIWSEIVKRERKGLMTQWK